MEEKNDIEQARRRFEQAISVSPQYAPAYYEMGKLELRANRIRKAAANLAHAIQINPASQRSYYLLMQVYWRFGERKKAQLVKQQWTAYKKAHPLLPAGKKQE